MDGRTVRRIRTRLGWTQRRLAAELGTDPVTVSRWERGVSRPRPSAMKRLRELLPPKDPRGRVVFSAEPRVRLGEVDRARREQLAMKDTARVPT